MADLTTYPLIDWFETTLAQAWNWAVGTIYLNSVPDITFPSGVTTYLVVNPWKTTMQIAEIDSVNTTNITANCTNVTLDKWAGEAYTQSSHGVGSIVRISHNYQFWKDIADAITSKLDTWGGNGLEYADTTARDAALWGDAVATKNYRLVKAGNVYYNYNLSTNQRESVDTWTATPNASPTVSGSVEIPTAAQMTAGDDTGETGAYLAVTPELLAEQIQSWSYTYWVDVWWDDAYVVALVPTLTAYTAGQLLGFKVTTANTGACTVDFWPWPKNIKTLHWNDPADGVIDGMCMVQYDGTNFVLYNNNDDVLATAIEDVWNYFGDGSDGDVTISSNTTLVSDRYYNNLTVNNGVTLNTWWFRIYVKETLTNDWTISRSGWNGGNGWSWPWTGWSLGAAGWGWAGWAWGQWGNNGAGATGSAWGWSTNDISWVNGWIGWAGWAWGWGWAAWGAGAAGVPASTTTAIFWIYNYSWFSSTVTTNLNDTKKIMEVFNILLTSWSSTLQVGSWWGGWGWWGSPSGGSNGWSWWGWWGSWWVVFICAKTIVNAWAIEAHWWNGGNWWTATGNGWGWGSGWGGSGGLYILLYKTLSWAWTTTATAGIAWVRSIWAGTWVNGNNGASGVAGKFIKIAITGNIT